MNPTLLSIANAIRSRINLQLSSQFSSSIKYDNVSYRPPSSPESTWLVTGIQWTGRVKEEVNQGGMHRQEGVLRLIVMTPVGSDDRAVLTGMQSCMSAFNNVDVPCVDGVVHFETPDPGTPSEDKGWYVGIVSCPFFVFVTGE